MKKFLMVFSFFPKREVDLLPSENQEKRENNRKKEFIILGSVQ
jgi:hypothetical protein